MKVGNKIRRQHSVCRKVENSRRETGRYGEPVGVWKNHRSIRYR